MCKSASDCFHICFVDCLHVIALLAPDDVLAVWPCRVAEREREQTNIYMQACPATNSFVLISGSSFEYQLLRYLDCQTVKPVLKRVMNIEGVSAVG